MFFLQTPRLALIETPLDVIRTRLERADFDAAVPTPSGTISVHFPEAWPGDELVLFPMYLEPSHEPSWGGFALELATGRAVGGAGCKGRPGDDGRVEIGYGLSPEARGKGYATELVGALVDWLLARPEVSAVTAETSVENRASQRVLEKCNFVRVGERTDEEDGPLYLWEKLSTC